MEQQVLSWGRERLLWAWVRVRRNHRDLRLHFEHRWNRRDQACEAYAGTDERTSSEEARHRVRRERNHSGESDRVKPWGSLGCWLRNSDLDRWGPLEDIKQRHGFLFCFCFWLNFQLFWQWALGFSFSSFPYPHSPPGLRESLPHFFHGGLTGMLGVASWKLQLTEAPAGLAQSRALYWSWDWGSSILLFSSHFGGSTIYCSISHTYISLLNPRNSHHLEHEDNRRLESWGMYSRSHERLIQI